MASLTFEITGLETLQRRLTAIGQESFEVLRRALEQHAEGILQASQPQVPVDTALLQSTGVVETDGETVTIRYGGHGAAPYAIEQHENTQYNHPNGGNHHYLSGPFNEALADLPEHIGQSVRQMLGG